MTTSEMTTADTSLWETAKSKHRLDLDLDAEPVAVQIAGSEPDQLAHAARAVVDRGAQIVDIRDVRELQRTGVIPGVMHAPRGMLEFWIDPESPYFKPEFAEDREFIFH